MKKRKIDGLFSKRYNLLFSILLLGIMTMLTGCVEVALDHCDLCGAADLSEEILQQDHGIWKCAEKAQCNRLFHYVFLGEIEHNHIQCELCNQWKCEGGDHGQGICTMLETKIPALLKNLTVMEGNTLYTLHPAFTANQYAYSINKTLKKGSKVVIRGEGANDNTLVTGDGMITLKEGNNEIRLSVKEGNAERVYKIQIRTEEELEKEEKKEQKKEEKTENKKEEKHEKKKIEDNDKETIKQIVYEPQVVSEDTESNQKSEADLETMPEEDQQLEINPNQEQQLESNQDSGQEQSTELAANLESLPVSSEASLQFLKVIIDGQDEQVIMLESGITEYMVEIMNANVKEIEVLGIATHENASVEGNGVHNIEIEDKEITVCVTAEDGITVQTYIIKIEYAEE